MWGLLGKVFLIDQRGTQTWKIKNYIQLNKKTQTTQLKKWTKGLFKEYIFPKKVYKWPKAYENMLNITSH